MTDTAIVLVFGVWLLLSVLRQTSGAVARSISRKDLFRLVPDWRLFSNPTRWDVRLLVRYRTEDGASSPWVRTLDGGRPWYAFLWHPQFAARVMAMEVANAAVARRSPASRRHALQSRRYGGFVEWLRDRAPAEATGVQFIVVAERAFDPEFTRTTMHLSDVFEVRAS